MTTEEKAKAYDRALEKARIYHDNAKAVKEYAAVARYENIFPELHEEEKPLTPFQQCLSRILYKVYYTSTPGSVDKFILGTIKRYTDELVALAKRHEYTDCQLHESENEKVAKAIDEIMKSSNAWKVAEKHGLTAGDIRRWVKKQKEQKPHYCHHEVDETGWSEEYRKAYYDGWNNCNMQHEQCKAEQKPAEWSEEEIEEMVNERATKSGTTKSEMAFYRNGIKDAIK